MSESYLLDTNAYFHFFKDPKSSAHIRLTQKLRKEDRILFFISEVTSLEINSVLGKYRRGSPRQKQKCDRKIVNNVKVSLCTNMWISPKRKKIGLRVYRDLKKMVSDIENQRGEIQATILKLDNIIFQRAKLLLNNYADHYNIGSHDALIAGSLLRVRDLTGLSLTLITSDRSFKAVLQEESIPFYDPQ